MTTSTLRTVAKLFASKLILQLESDKYLTREFMNYQKWSYNPQCKLVSLNQNSVSKESNCLANNLEMMSLAYSTCLEII